MDTDVIVVGAGAAGLAASLALASRSVRVIVADGRERTGGRVRWERIGSAPVPVELGAEFIHGDAPETSAYLRAAGLRAIATSDASWTCTAAGGLQPDEDDFNPGDLFDAARSLERDESVEVYLRRFDADPTLRERARIARSFVEGFEAADPALASARAIADELHSGVDETSSRPVGSYAPLFEDLTARCVRAGVDVRLRTTVERVMWSTEGVAVVLRDASGDVSTLRAHCAVITVPVGVLQQRSGATPLAFAPPLPAAKETALRGLEMGRVVRVTLAFATPFWEELAGGRYRDAAFFHCETGPFGAFWTQVPQRARTIVAWAGGPRVAAFASMSEPERIASACDAFGAMFGAVERARETFEGGATHDWSADPFACGAYSYVATGGGDARAMLGEPVGDVVFFAGEATATDGQGGTVSGAFATGLRAAREVAGALGIGEPAPATRA